MYDEGVRVSPSVHSQHSLNARLLRFRSQPDSEDAYALAEDLLHAERYADARSVVSLALPKDRDDAALLVLEARAYMLERDLIRAQSALLRAIKAEPGLQSAYRYLGEILLKRGDPARAQKTLRRALKLLPDDAEASQLLDRAEYLAEAANDSLEALPSPLDSVLDSVPAAGNAAPEPSAPPASNHPEAALAQAAEPPRDTEPTRGPPDPDVELVQVTPKGTPARPRREDEPTSQYRRFRRGTTGAEGTAPSAAPASAGASVPPPLPQQRTAPPRTPLPLSAELSQPQQSPLPVPATAAQAKTPKPPQAPAGPNAGEQSARDATSHRARARSEEPAPRTSADGPALRASARARDAAPLRNQAYGKRLSDFASLRRDEQSSRPGYSAPRTAHSASERSHEPEALGGGGAVGAEASGREALAQSAPDAPADADEALEVIQKLGLFEDPSTAPAMWADRSEVPVRGQRLRGALLWLWSITLLLCVAGYFGWNELVRRRHAAAAELVAQAGELMLRGDHEALVDAERMLRLAREQHPASTQISERALVLQEQRVLDDAEGDMAALRSAYTRAHAAELSGPSMPLADLLLSAAIHDAAGRDRAASQVLAQAAGDAQMLYLLGRAEQRLGHEAAAAHLEAAAVANPKLIPAQLALAEQAYDRGERAAALRLLDTATKAAPTQLRVQLFRMLVSADDVEPQKLRQELNGLAQALRKGGSIDQALASLVRARLARRAGERAAAIKAVEAAAQSGVAVARVLAWVAQDAQALMNLPLAQQVASRALSLAPENPSYRRILARILVERGAGQQAFVLLAGLPGDDIEVQTLKAQAALLADEPELLRAALQALPEVALGKGDIDVRLASLRVRIETRLEPTKAVIDRARALVRSAQADPDALLALAEAALAMHQPKLTQSALKQRSALVPDAADTQILLGRAARMSGDEQDAEAAFQKALSLSPGHVEAQTALASLLLDRGDLAAADELYRQLATRDETALVGRLGRAEALLGLGKADDAQVQLEAVPEPLQGTVAFREVAAKLMLARGEVGEALKLLRPLSAEQPTRASLRALYADGLLAATQLSAAADEYSAALQLDAELPEALLGRAEVELRSKKTKDALATLDRAARSLRQRIRPPAVQARRLVLRGQTLLQRKKRGDADAAVNAFREAVDLPGAPADVFYFLADALGNKDKAAAREAAQRYLELAPDGAYRQRAQRMLGAAR